ncbi:MAG: type I restriction enzyme, S subunit [Candidatus Methanomarinus sp.]|nr:MAG: type I restriction enzyme, S subunit [ANME-2 cluster archaeon]
MSEWKEYILEDVIDKFIDYRGKTPKKMESGIPLITAKIVKRGKILEPNEFIAPEDYDSWMTRGLPEIDDIVLTTEAPLGEIALIKNKNVALAQRIITLRGKKQYVFNPFLKYYFQSSIGQYELQSRASGTTVFGIKAAVLRKVPVCLPPLPEQRAIASILSSLDDKIDLLHRQNQTLEAMAEALFRQWFVEEADEGWETARVGDFVHTNIASINKDNALKTIRYLDTGSLTEGKIDGYQTFDIADAPSRARRIVKHNNVLISTVRPNQKHYGILKNPAEDVIVSTGFCVITCDKINPHFIYILLTTDEMTEYLHSIAEGSTSTYPSLKPSDIERLDFQLPPHEKLDAFSEHAYNT